MLAKTANDSLQLDPAIVEMLLVIYGVIMLFAVVVYFLHAIGMYSVAKRRRIPRPWLAFLPIGGNWILGGISDRYQFVKHGRFRNRKKLLACMELATYALSGAIYVFFGSLLVNMQTLIVTYRVQYMGWNGKYTYRDQTVKYPPREDNILAAEQLLLVLLFAVFLLSIIFLLFRYFAYYDYYASCRPDLKVVFLVLSIVFPVTLPFFVFACRKHDLGLAEQPKQENSIAGIWVEAASTTYKD